VSLSLNISLVCILYGENFSPAEAERRTGIKLSKTNAPGEIAPRGRYRGKPYPYGSAELRELDESQQGLPDLEKSLVVDVLTANIEAFRGCGATDIWIDIAVGYEDQCNLEFTPSFLTKVARLGIPVALTCYQRTLRGE
jgi:hypothetical protein